MRRALTIDHDVPHALRADARPPVDVRVKIDRETENQILELVGVTGFEPATPASRRRCSTKLSYTPIPLSVALHRKIGESREDLAMTRGR